MFFQPLDFQYCNKHRKLRDTSADVFCTAKFMKMPSFFLGARMRTRPAMPDGMYRDAEVLLKAYKTTKNY
jgi:hypothetical protein